MDRRDFLKAAASGMIAATTGSSALARMDQPPPHSSLIKQIDRGMLQFGFSPLGGGSGCATLPLNVRDIEIHQTSVFPVEIDVSFFRDDVVAHTAMMLCCPTPCPELQQETGDEIRTMFLTSVPLSCRLTELMYFSDLPDVGHDLVLDEVWASFLCCRLKEGKQVPYGLRLFASAMKEEPMAEKVGTGGWMTECFSTKHRYTSEDRWNWEPPVFHLPNYTSTYYIRNSFHKRFPDKESLELKAGFYLPIAQHLAVGDYHINQVKNLPQVCSSPEGDFISHVFSTNNSLTRTRCI